MSKTYYKNELKRIKTDDEYQAQIILMHEDIKTKHISLNQDSAQILANFLLERFGVSALSDTCKKCGCNELLCGHKKGK